MTRLAYSLAVVALIFISGCEGRTAPEAESSFRTNEYGESYGSAEGAQSLDDEPELISAMATNGASGYVRKDDLYAGEPQNPEEAVAHQQARDDIAAIACLDSVRAEVEGIPADPSISETGRSSVRELMNARVAGTLPTDGVVALKSLLAESGVAESSMPSDLAGLAGQCAAAAEESQIRRIPVYQSDGVTAIGEFEVGR